MTRRLRRRGSLWLDWRVWLVGVEVQRGGWLGLHLGPVEVRWYW